VNPPDRDDDVGRREWILTLLLLDLPLVVMVGTLVVLAVVIF
jgi:hypothetical protein